MLGLWGCEVASQYYPNTSSPNTSPCHLVIPSSSHDSPTKAKEQKCSPYDTRFHRAAACMENVDTDQIIPPVPDGRDQRGMGQGLFSLDSLQRRRVAQG